MILCVTTSNSLFYFLGRPEEPEFFAFHEYLAVKLAEEFMEIIEVDAKTWASCLVQLLCPVLTYRSIYKCIIHI